MPLTAEETKALTDQITTSIVGSDGFVKALGDGIRRIVPGIVADATKGVAESVTKITEQLGDLSKKLDAAPPPEPKPGKKGEDAPDEATAKLNAVIAEQKAAIQRIESERQAEREKAKADRMRASFLSSAKVGDQPIKGADLIWARYGKEFEEAEDGRLKIKVKKKYGGQEYEESITIDEWVPEYLQSDEGKMFAPAKNAGGSGGAQGSGLPRAGEKPTREQLVNLALS